MKGISESILMEVKNRLKRNSRTDLHDLHPKGITKAYDGETVLDHINLDIYDNEPQNAFVADFIGESNILNGIMLEDRKVKFHGQVFECVDEGFGKNEPVDVVVRPEDVDIVPEDRGQLKGVVTSVTFLGVHYEIIVDVQGFKWMIQTTDFCAAGSHIGLSIEPDAIQIFAYRNLDPETLSLVNTLWEELKIN